MKRTVVVSVLFVAGAGALGQVQGPTSSAAPYVVPAAKKLTTVSLITAGDQVPNPNGGMYTFAGRPEGTGILKNDDGTFTLLVNHNFAAGQGSVRAHGATGSFISRLTVDPDTLEVVSGQDQIKSTWTWNAVVGTWVQTPTQLARLSSANLAGPSAFFDVTGGLGTLTRLYLTGEELGEGRAFCNIVSTNYSGLTYEMPRFGNISWQNCVAAPGYGLKTVVAGIDGPATGEIYMYIGMKTASPGILDSAGLTNGFLYGVKVQGLADEDPATGLGGPTSLPFTLESFGDVSAWDGATLQSESDAADVMAFIRPRDAHWDRNDPRKLYFATNGNDNAPSRLWMLQFSDLSNPEAGGTLHLILDGTEGIVKADNIVVDEASNVLIQESPGDDQHLAGIWYYQPQSGDLDLIAEHDAALFTPGEPGFITQNEESSGIIDARDALGEGYYIYTSQPHVLTGNPDTVEDGQVMAMWVLDAVDCVGDVNKDGQRNILDLAAFQGQFQAHKIEADLNFDQIYNVLDFVQFNFYFGAACP